jgi:hypothetical protein
MDLLHQCVDALLDPRFKNDQSPITNNQFFDLHLRPDPQPKAFVIGDW